MDEKTSLLLRLRAEGDMLKSARSKKRRVHSLMGVLVLPYTTAKSTSEESMHLGLQHKS